MPKAQRPESLNVCLVTKKFPILGRAIDYGFLWPIARGMAQRQHNVTVLAWDNPENKKEIVQDNVQAYFLREYPTQPITEFPRLVLEKFAQLHQQEPFHIVHSVDNSARRIGAQKKRFRVAMTYDVEATHMSQIFSLLGRSGESGWSQVKTALAVAFQYMTTYYGFDRFILNSADAMFVTTPQQRLTLERHYDYPEYKTYSIPYGIEVGDLSPREHSQELKNKLGLPEAAQTVVTLSDMHEAQTVKYLLQAFEKVAIKKPHARLIIVGDGPKFREIEFEMLNLALSRRVVFVRNASETELADYISISDVFVNLSHLSSGFEPSLIEAMAQKKVIIGSEVSPISYLVEDSVNGYLIRPADTSSLSKIILDVFNQDVSTQEMGEAARKKVLNFFAFEKMLDETLTAYKKAIVDSGFYRDPQPFLRLKQIFS